MNAAGPIPEGLWNLTYLVNLYVLTHVLCFDFLYLQLILWGYYGYFGVMSRLINIQFQYLRQTYVPKLIRKKIIVTCKGAKVSDSVKLHALYHMCVYFCLHTVIYTSVIWNIYGCIVIRLIIKFRYRNLNQNYLTGSLSPSIGKLIRMQWM